MLKQVIAKSGIFESLEDRVSSGYDVIFANIDSLPHNARSLLHGNGRKELLISVESFSDAVESFEVLSRINGLTGKKVLMEITHLEGPITDNLMARLILIAMGVDCHLITNGNILGE